MVRVADLNWMDTFSSDGAARFHRYQSSNVYAIFIYLFIYFSYSQNLIQHEQKVLIKTNKQNKLKWRRK